MADLLAQPRAGHCRHGPVRGSNDRFRPDARAIRECEEHGWMQDRADPHARERAIPIARQDPPAGFSPDDSVAAIEDVLGSIGDTCPECPPDAD
jgi:hypothetical protein